MEDNKNNIDELKQGAKETYGETKEALKNMNFEDELKATEGFLKEFLKNPFNGVVQAAEKRGNLILAIVLTIFWMFASGMARFINFFRWSHVSFFSIFQMMFAPLIGIIVMSAIILVFNKNKNKNLTDILSIVVVTRIPLIVATILSLLTIFSSEATRLTSPISAFANGISILLLYVAMRTMSEEKDEGKYFMIFLVAYGVYFVARFIISFLGIHI